MLTSGKCNHHHKVCLFTVCHSPISCRFGGVIMLIKSVFVSTYCQQLLIVVNKARKKEFFTPSKRRFLCLLLSRNAL